MPADPPAERPVGTLTVKRRTDGRWVIISISGELDMATTNVLRRALDVGSLGGRTHVALDLSGLQFCDSAGLGVLIGAWDRLRAEGGQLTLMHMPERIARLLRITGLEHLFSGDPPDAGERSGIRIRTGERPRHGQLASSAGTSDSAQ